MEFLTLDQVDVKGRVVVVRVDINSPIDPKSGEILDTTRIRLCAPTLRELALKGARVVVLAHQGRPGGEDFTTLEKHAQKLSEATGLRVEYLPDPVCPFAIHKIRLMKPGEILLLENVRMLAEEVAKLKPEQQVRTHMVRLLKSVAHVFVNDAFGAAHRSSPSLVGLAEVLPACAGRLMEREVRGLGKALSPEHPCLYVLGGAKFDDSLQIIEHVIKNGVADSILTGGLVGHAFLTVVGVDLGAANLEILRKHGYEEQAARAKDLAQRFAEKIMVPIDVVIEADGKPLTVDIAPTAHTCTIAELKSALERSPPPSIQHPIYDIGPKTVARYSELIRGAKTVVANGPLGVFERPGYERGTFGVLRAMADSQAYTVIGGGHIVAAAAAAGVTDRLSHVSTGGGAAITFLSGAPLPAVEALKRAARRVRA